MEDSGDATLKKVAQGSSYLSVVKHLFDKKMLDVSVAEGTVALGDDAVAAGTVERTEAKGTCS